MSIFIDMTMQVIYTTTPWTIPSNIAISIHPEFMYNIIQDDNNQDSMLYLLSLPFRLLPS